MGISKTTNEDFTLSPPPEKDVRHLDFKDAIFAFFRYRYQRNPPWGPADGNQLHRLLAENPELDLLTFKRWLYNYARSQDYPPGESPHRFLPRIGNYSMHPLDKMRKSIYAQTITVKDESILRSRSAALAARREEERHRLLAGETQKLLPGETSTDARRVHAMAHRPNAVHSHGD